MLLSVVPLILEQRSGVIININSVTQQIGFQCSSASVIHTSRLRVWVNP